MEKLKNEIIKAQKAKLERLIDERLALIKENNEQAQKLKIISLKLLEVKEELEATRKVMFLYYVVDQEEQEKRQQQIKKMAHNQLRTALTLIVKGKTLIDAIETAKTYSPLEDKPGFKFFQSLDEKEAKQGA